MKDSLADGVIDNEERAKIKNDVGWINFARSIYGYVCFVTSKREIKDILQKGEAKGVRPLASVYQISV